jgi:hypothetical protein
MIMRLYEGLLNTLPELSIPEFSENIKVFLALKTEVK